MGLLGNAVWVVTYGVLDLELLALCDIGGLGNGSLQSVQSSVVEGLKSSLVSPCIVVN